jgi:hypothetical protein
MLAARREKAQRTSLPDAPCKMPPSQAEDMTCAGWKIGSMPAEEPNGAHPEEW